MLTFDPNPTDRPLRLLCIGAHCDDLEIGCGGTLLQWLARYSQVDVTWAVLSAQGERAKEARRSATTLLRGAIEKTIVLYPFRDGHFPAQFVDIKKAFAELAAAPAHDVVFTHSLDDRHQDHRLVAELTWQTFRNHLVLEYEIPKYEGDLGKPNLFVPLSASVARRKIAHLMRSFPSQAARDWFRPETFSALMTLRGVESRAPSGSAEAFMVRKFLLGPTA